MTYRMLSGNLSSGRTSIFELQRKVSSGKNVTLPSDDPGMYEIILRLQADLSNNAQFERNLQQVQRELVSVENVLRNTLQLYQRAGELAIRGSDGTTSSSDKQAIATEVNQLLENLVGQANFHEAGHYRFAGLRSDAIPYTTADADGDGWIDTVAYTGSQETKQIEISRGSYVSATLAGSNLSGDNAVFQTQNVDLFNELIDLRDKLMAGEDLVDEKNFTADPATDTLTVAGVFTTGTTIRISSTGTLPGGLSADTDYYAIEVAGGIQLADSLENARNGIPMDITDAGSGDLRLKSTTLASINSAVDHINTLLSTVGAREETLSLHESILQEHQANINQALEKAQSVDVAKAIMELSQQETAYSAALRVSSMFLEQPSLADYL